MAHLPSINQLPPPLKVIQRWDVTENVAKLLKYNVRLLNLLYLLAFMISVIREHVGSLMIS